MESLREQQRITLYFYISVSLKGLVSLAEAVTGVVAFFVPASVASGWLVWLAQSGLGGGFLSGFALEGAQQLSAASGTFIAAYLLARGLIKLGLVAALLRKALWAYPAAFVVLGLFVLYQLYQYAVGHSIFIALLTIFDIIVIYFIWREYRLLRERAYTSMSA